MPRLKSIVHHNHHSFSSAVVFVAPFFFVLHQIFDALHTLKIYRSERNLIQKWATKKKPSDALTKRQFAFCEREPKSVAVNNTRFMRCAVCCTHYFPRTLLWYRDKKCSRTVKYRWTWSKEQMQHCKIICYFVCVCVLFCGPAKWYRDSAANVTAFVPNLCVLCAKFYKKNIN